MQIYTAGKKEKEEPFTKKMYKSSTNKNEERT